MSALHAVLFFFCTADVLQLLQCRYPFQQLQRRAHAHNKNAARSALSCSRNAQACAALLRPGPCDAAVHFAACRRLTPNFKIRAEVGFNTRCSFPLTLKVYVITQQEKDSVPEWVPDDFLDPDLPQVSGLAGCAHWSPIGVAVAYILRL